jgi:deoxyribodipyrimidine photo-lyase
MNLVLFQRELRLEDNNLLIKANSLSKDFIPIFIFDKKELSKIKNKEYKRITFLVKAVLNLKKKFKKGGSDLLIFYGDIFSILDELNKKLKPNNIIVGRTYEKKINNIYKKFPNIIEVKDGFLTNFDILKSDKTPYKVFTPYKNEMLKTYKVDKENLENTTLPKVKNTKSDKLINKKTESEILKILGFKYSELGDFDINLLQKHYDDFFRNKIQQYHISRDYPATLGTSKLSPYLRYGLISIRKCFNKALEYKNLEGGKIWLSELIWREFYATIMYHFPESQNNEFVEKYSKIKWGYDKVLLGKFQKGETGFPIVDAGVKELLKTGWMHNRVRMIVASFFVKNLGLDWRLGEEFFANYLVDYEASSNVGGWQWSASTGVDAQPYFRVFNPFLQSDKFDPAGIYIKKYVKKLSGFDAELLHKDENIKGYFEQIINYKKSKEQIIKAFKKI